MARAQQPSLRTANEVIEQARAQLARQSEENTEFNDEFSPTGLTSIAQQMSTKIAESERTGQREVQFRFPIAVGKQLHNALMFFISILSLPVRIIKQIWAMIRRRRTPPPSENWNRSLSFLHEKVSSPGFVSLYYN